MSETDTYRIISLEAENVKRLKAIHITPTGQMVEITGANGNGKTSCLDAIFWALTNARDIQRFPIRKGQESAVIKLDLGNLKIRRTFTAKEDGGHTTKLFIENADGARYSKPQDILAALVGELSFDPLEFTRLKAKDQFDALKKFVPEFDFVAEAAKRQKDFEDRTEVNRHAKQLRAQAGGMKVPDGTPDEEVDESALVAELADVGNFNARIAEKKSNRERFARQIDTDTKAIEQLRAKAEELRRQAKEHDERAAELEAEVATRQKKLDEATPLPEPTDTATVQKKIEDARRINEGVRVRKRRDEIVSEAKKLEKQSEDLTAAIEARDAAKRKAISEAKMPIDGLGFGEDFITLNGQPFDQASGAEQLRASVAIAAAMNPKLHVIRIKDASLLDEDSWRMLADFARERDFQVWAETVNSDRPGAVIIEDGEVRGIVPAEAAE